MKKITILILFVSFFGYSQVGVGTTNPDSTFDIVATNPTGASTNVDGILIPRVDRQRAQSMTGTITSTMIYVNSIATGTAAGTAINITSTGFYYYDGSVWQKIATGASTDWALAGNGGTTAGTNFIGTTDAVDIRIKTGGNDRWNISNANNGQLQSYSLGSITAPIYSFQGDTNTGIFSSAADNLGFVTNGTEKLRIPNADQIHAMSLGTAALPFYSFSNDPNTGIFSPAGGDILAVATNGTEKVRVESDGDVGIGVTPDSSAKLDVSATNRGFLAPRVALTSTTAAGPITTPATGLLVYNTATAGASPTNVVPGYYYNSGTTAAPVWKRFSTGNGDGWQTTGNAGTGAANYVGTSDAVDFKLSTTGTERMRIVSGGQVIVNNTAAPIAGDRFSVYNTAATDYAINGYSTSTGTGVYGQNTGGGIGVQGLNNSVGYGVYGSNSSTGYGVRGYNSGTSIGVFGTSVNGTGNLGAGVYGNANTGSGVGVFGSSSGATGTGVWGNVTGNTGAGIYGQSTGANGTGVFGYVNGAGNSDGVYGESATAGRYGVWGVNNTNTGFGVRGSSTGTTSYGVYGTSTGTAGFGVYGIETQANRPGVYGVNDNATGNGVYGTSTGTTGYGVYGISTGTSGVGVYGNENQAGRFGVLGINNNATGVGTSGQSTGATGVGVSGLTSGTDGTGVIGSSTGTNADGVYGQATGATGYGVWGLNNNATGNGVVGNSSGATGNGVAGIATGTIGYGVYGVTTGSDGTAVYGTSSGSNADGVYGQATGATGYGVWGVNNNATGTGTVGSSTGTNAVGVYGIASGSNGIGVAGDATTATNAAISGRNLDTAGTGIIASGNNAGGVYLVGGSGGAFNGTSYGSASWATNTATGIGVAGAGNGQPVTTIGTTGAGGAFTGNQWALTGVATITGAANDATDRGVLIGNYVSGGSTIDDVYVGARIAGVNYKILGTGGGSVSTTMKTSQGERILFAPEATENWFFDMGEVELVNGKATVNLDPIFVETLSNSKPFKVFVQGSENTLGSIRITRNQTDKTFVVEDMGGASNGIVQYSIYGIWKGKENLRLPELKDEDKPKQVIVENNHLNVDSKKSVANKSDKAKANQFKAKNIQSTREINMSATEQEKRAIDNEGGKRQPVQNTGETTKSKGEMIAKDVVESPQSSEIKVTK